MTEIDALTQPTYRYLRCVELHLRDELAETLAGDVTAVGSWYLPEVVRSAR